MVETVRKVVTKTGMIDTSISMVICILFFFLMIRRPPGSTPLYSSAASDVYKRQRPLKSEGKRSFSHLAVLITASGLQGE